MIIVILPPNKWDIHPNSLGVYCSLFQRAEYRNERKKKGPQSGKT
jgi:hypothetical protein